MPRKLSHFLYQDETKAVKSLLKPLPWEADRAGRVHDDAVSIVESARRAKTPMGQIEAFLKDYSLETEEGIALMCLAEALLRIPDKSTANALIRDKVAAANWLDSVGGSQDWVVKAAGVGLFMTSRTLDGVFSRIGEPFIREAMIRAMRIMGLQFVLGTDIEDAMQRAEPLRKRGYRMSYDILGEGARTQADADRYFENYAAAIQYIGERGSKDPAKRPGISIKLSALHPRYEFAQEGICVPALTDSLTELARAAAVQNITLTVDAEECARLELSLDIITGTLKNIDKEWGGFGLAIQAYQKRCLPLIDHVAELANTYSQKLHIRLVKGAYWDTEIKHAQVEGYPGFPVFTRKSNTDVSYLACAYKLFEQAESLYPMFATHNAHSIAAMLDFAKEFEGAPFEFQRLYGMGKTLYDTMLAERELPVSVYAPVGPHADLLPYLVRRLLENGANTSFVNRMLDPSAPVRDIVEDPVEKVRIRKFHGHPNIRLPDQLYHEEGSSGRLNSQGLDLSDPPCVDQLFKDMDAYTEPYTAGAVIAGEDFKDSVIEECKNPGDQNGDRNDVLGHFWPAQKGLVNKAMRTADAAFADWNGTDPNLRAQILETAADLYEANRAELMALCVREAGKTIPDALAEIREAVDFLRYYAARGRIDFAQHGMAMIGPTGESNTLTLQGRGVFVCISPWNFPLAIFTGQIAAALMAGNSVVSKPAEQTPLIAARAVALLHEAGIPPEALNLAPGDGRIGAALVADARVSGVAFTGSTEVAREINRTLAGKDGPIAPLIAETGGQNAMIVDSSALPEQVIDDVILSAFGSAGQRCSALRILYIQDDVADQMIRMLKGAMEQLRVGPPCELSSDIGPVIDEEAYATLTHHREALHGFGKLIYEVPVPDNIKENGHYFGPCAFEIPDLKGLEREVFGPVLHVIRYAYSDLDEILKDVQATGYGLTLGIHSRIDAFQNKVINSIRAGNMYVNRSMIGAVVGTQPFGGQGLSGTGPKAGGPHYLHRFATERTLTIDTTAMGGNASLVSLTE